MHSPPFFRWVAAASRVVEELKDDEDADDEKKPLRLCEDADKLLKSTCPPTTTSNV